MKKKLSLWEKIRRFLGGVAVFFREMEDTYNERCKQRLADGTGTPSAYQERG